MASNIHNMAEPDMKSDHQLCVAGFYFSDSFQHMLAAQTQLALDRNPGEFTAWVSLSDGRGNGGVINLLSPQPRKIPVQGLVALSNVLKARSQGSARAAQHDLSALRMALPDTLPVQPCDLGVLASIPLASEITHVSAQLWVARHAEADWSSLELERLNQLAFVLGTGLERELDLLVRERNQRAEQRMTDMSHRVADLFAAPGLPISGRFRSLLDTCCNAFDMEQGYVTLMQSGHPRIQFATTHMNYSAPDAPAPKGPYFSGQLLRDPSPLALSDVAASPHAKLVDLTGVSVGRFLGCPIRFDGRTHGTIELVGTSPALVPFTQMEIAMLRSVSIYAAGPLVLLGEALSF